MPPSLFDNKTAKQFDKIASKKAKLDTKAQNLVDEFMEKTSSATIKSILDVVDEHGHPAEQSFARQFRVKYNSGGKLTFDDVMTLEKLFKSNRGSFRDYNKKVSNCD